MYILKLNGTIENSSKKKGNMEVIEGKKRSSEPVEILEYQIKTFKASRSLSSPVSPIIHHTAFDCPRLSENAHFQRIPCPNILNFKTASERYCPNILTSDLPFDKSPNNSCSSSHSTVFVTAPDTTPVDSISSWGSCH